MKNIIVRNLYAKTIQKIAQEVHKSPERQQRWYKLVIFTILIEFYHTFNVKLEIFGYLNLSNYYLTIMKFFLFFDVLSNIIWRYRYCIQCVFACFFILNWIYCVFRLGKEQQNAYQMCYLMGIFTLFFSYRNQV